MFCETNLVGLFLGIWVVGIAGVVLGVWQTSKLMVLCPHNFRLTD
jgi:predicted PurR-regulated permease PerM